MDNLFIKSTQITMSQQDSETVKCNWTIPYLCYAFPTFQYTINDILVSQP